METMERYEAMRANNGEPAQQVDEQRWWDMLEVLPPENWTRRADSESFMVIECQTANLYTWMVRVGSGDAATFWEMVAPNNATHHDLLRHVAIQAEKLEG
jgi:hypothetical protein